MLHVHTRFLSRFPQHPSRFYCTLVRFHHVVRVCTTLLLCPQYVNVICTEFLLHYPYILHSETELSNKLLPSVYICNFINLSAEREVCKPKSLSLSFFFLVQKGRSCLYNRSHVAEIVIRTWKNMHVDMLEHDIILCPSEIPSFFRCLHIRVSMVTDLCHFAISFCRCEITIICGFTLQNNDKTRR